ncbi:aminoglycoside phosphotransferase [Geodermatophilus sp. TF02-6]|uniref:fructosamine kinase family protein n=1 Tax=Geodermatophilus sp. TF02-6 TaxID=2250575 RepID=UPI000DE881C1|nr:fructosamine kinase family protein [Geodermatophilus sp. TF02-6]RBY83743.1 aminoglycoside phosphotransferase [Geodermatophilus sp. TF02-6]
MPRGDDGEAWPAGLPPLAHGTPLPGGWVGRTRRGRLVDGREVVVKQSPHPADAEADSLQALAAAGVPVPGVLGVAAGTLVLEYVTGRPNWAGLGHAVARMHGTSGPAFGWHRDNCAGRFRQDNGWLDSWGTFYAERRVRTHLSDPTVPADLRARLHRACDGPLPRLLPRSTTPALTHGDLWAGNVVDGRWLVDPEVSYADRELDLAYMQASRSLPPRFWAAYQRARPLEPGFAARRPALQLHHLLLEVRHFGPQPHRRGVEAVLDHYGW